MVKLRLLKVKGIQTILLFVFLLGCSLETNAVLDPQKFSNPQEAFLVSTAYSYISKAKSEELLNGLNKTAAIYYRSAGAAFLKAGHKSSSISPLLKYFEFLGSNEPDSRNLHVTVLQNFVDALIADGQTELAEKYLAKLETTVNWVSGREKFSAFSHLLLKARLHLIQGERIAYSEIIGRLIETTFDIMFENPNRYVEAKNQLNLTLIQAGDYDRMLAFRRNAHKKKIEVFGEHKGADLALAVEEISILKLMGNLEEARNIIERTLLLSDLPDKYKGDLIKTLGDILLEIGDYKGALVAFSTAEKLDQTSNFNLMIGITLAKLGKKDLAFERLERAFFEYQEYVVHLSAFERMTNLLTIAKLAVELDKLDVARRYNEESKSLFDGVNSLGDLRLIGNHQISLEIANKTDELEDWLEVENAIYPVFEDALFSKTELLFLDEHKDLLIKAYSKILNSDKGAEYEARAVNVIDKLTRGKIDQAVQSAYMRSKIADDELVKLVHKRDYLNLQLQSDRQNAESAKRLIKQINENSSALLIHPEVEKLGFVQTKHLMRDIQGKLKASSAIINYIATKDKYYALLITKHGVSLTPVSGSKREIDSLIVKLRDSVNPGYDASLSEFDYVSASALYQQLIEPLGDMLNDIRHLNIIPADNLLSIPFLALILNEEDRNSWLFKRYTISISPGLSAIVANRIGSKHMFSKKFLGFGDPVYAIQKKLEHQDEVKTRSPNETTLLNSGLPPLPQTRQELIGIAEFFGESESRLFLGEAANETNVVSHGLSDYQYISFATHGLLSSENVNQEPGLAMSVFAEQSGIVDESLDGVLSASEIMGLDIKAEIVFLSACNTSGTEDQGKYRGLAGLTSSFLFAGAQSVVVSNWAVESRSAAHIISRTTQFLSTEDESAVASLNKAFESVFESESFAMWRHPYYWAPFFVVGTF